MSLSVVQVATAFSSWGITELHILEISSHLQKRGHQVVIACRPESWVQQQAEQLALATVPITISRHHDFQDFGKLSRLLRTVGADVVHVHERQDIMVCALAAMKERVPVRVMTRHVPHGLNNRRGARLYSNVLLSHVIAPTRAVKDALIASGMNAERIQTIPISHQSSTILPSASSAAMARQSAGIGPGCIVVGVLRHMERGGGHLEFVEAVQRLHKTRLRFLVVGEGRDEDVIHRYVQASGLKDQFTFASFDRNVECCLGAMDIVVVPATQPDTVSTVVQCAMALGKPIVATAVGVHLDMIVDDVSGMLVAPADPANLAAAIERLAADGPLRTRLGAGAAARAASAFLDKEMVDQIEALYCSPQKRFVAARLHGIRESVHRESVYRESVHAE